MRDVTYRVVVAAVHVLFAALGLRVTVRGAEHVPSTGGAVLASNHVGFLDFTFVGLVGRRRGRFVRFMTKESVFRPPLVGRAMRAMGHLPVDRRHGVAALRSGVRSARAGEVVGVFPEATISPTFEVAQLKAGAAFVAVREQVPLVPVVVWGSQHLLTVGPRWSLRRGRAVTVLVGEALHPGPDESPYDVTQRLRERLLALREEAVATTPSTGRAARSRRAGPCPTPAPSR